MRHFAVVLALALAAGCTSEPTSTESVDQASIRVTANVAGTPIATLVVEVSAADIITPLVFNLVVDGVTGVATGTVKVPHGPARTFHITAFDAAGDTTHEGEATIDVRPGQNPPLQVTLGPRSGHVPVTVSFGDFSVIVTPSSAVLAVAGQTVQLTAQVIDEYGTPLPEGTQVQWATTNPALVTVDASGLVTASGPAGTVLFEEALIVATYEGVAGFSTIQPAQGAGTEDLDGDGYSVAAGDCDDTRPDVSPSAAEALDGTDNDCDGSVDEDFEMVIAEVQASAAVGSVEWGEWIEVWNAGDEAVNPNGLLLVVNDQSCRVVASTSVPAHGYFTINFGVYGGHPYQFSCVSEVGLSALPDGSLDLRLGTGIVVADEPVMSNVLDQVILPFTAVTGTPWSLDPFASDPLSNDLLTNWCLSSVEGGTPLSANPSCP
jgi:hypothetical protein